MNKKRPSQKYFERPQFFIRLFSQTGTRIVETRERLLGNFRKQKI